MNSIRIIKSEKEYNQMLDRLEIIFDAPPGTPEGDESELLALLIEKFEEEHHPIPDPDPIEAIKYMMEQNNMKVKDLADYPLIFKDNHYGRIEDAHLILCHLISSVLYEMVNSHK